MIMPSDWDPLPGGEIVINVTTRVSKFCLKFSHRRAEIDVMLCRMTFQILQPPFQFKDRLFKIERLPFHNQVKRVTRLKGYKVVLVSSGRFGLHSNIVTLLSV